MYNQIADNKRRTALLMVVVFVLLIALGYIFAEAYQDPSILWGAVIFSIIFNWFGYFNSDKIAISTSGARKIDPNHLEDRKIENLVENICITAGIPMPKVFIIEDSAMNAFATGRNPKNASIALTRGLIDKLDKAELEGVIAHELSHVKNYDILLSTIVVTLVGSVTLLADFFMRGNMFRSRDDRNSGNVLILVGLALAILAPLFATLLQLAISRRREYLADASGALLTRYPEGLASALEKISAHPQTLRNANRATAHLYFVSPFAGRIGESIAHLFSTHPPAKERIKILRGMNL